jgi:prepilin-type N-terminal cleavage/methylation domain-containing protein
MRLKGQQGFTLIELIVVSAILTALMAIAIPQFFSYREKAERASIISDCRGIYRGFILYYLEHNEFPYTTAEALAPWPGFALNSFFPLTDPSWVGGENLDPIAKNLLTKIAGTPPAAEVYDSPDANDQTFYLVLPWLKDPNIKFIIAQSDNVTYADGTLVDVGNWLDGVFTADRDGKIFGK